MGWLTDFKTKWMENSKLVKGSLSSRDPPTRRAGRFLLVLIVVFSGYLIQLGMARFQTYKGSSENRKMIESPPKVAAGGVDEANEKSAVAKLPIAGEEFQPEDPQQANLGFFQFETYPLNQLGLGTVEIVVECTTVVACDEIKVSPQKTRDYVISVLIQISREEVLNRFTKADLRRKILQKLNQTLENKPLTNVYFSDVWVEDQGS